VAPWPSSAACCADALRTGRGGFSCRFRSFAVHSEVYCLPHAEGAEDAENRRGTTLFSASSAPPREAPLGLERTPNQRNWSHTGSTGSTVKIKTVDPVRDKQFWSTAGCSPGSGVVHSEPCEAIFTTGMHIPPGVRDQFTAQAGKGGNASLFPVSARGSRGAGPAPPGGVASQIAWSHGGGDSRPSARDRVRTIPRMRADAAASARRPAAASPRGPCVAHRAALHCASTPPRSAMTAAASVPTASRGLVELLLDGDSRQRRGGALAVTRDLLHRDLFVPPLRKGPHHHEVLEHTASQPAGERLEQPVCLVLLPGGVRIRGQEPGVAHDQASAQSGHRWAVPPWPIWRLLR
jgi:hypothetical protein